MTRKKQQQQDEPVTLFSLYGGDAVSVGSRLDTYNQYKEARRLLLDKGILTADELAGMTDGDVEEAMDRHFVYIHSNEDTLVVIRRADVPTVENLIVRLDR